MTQEEKELLFKDLCARLPYGAKGLHRGQVHELFTIDGREVNSACIQVDGYDAWFPVETFIPYLRPMSSMTEEERKEYESFFSIGEYSCGGSLYGEEYEYINDDYDDIMQSVSLIDWLNAHHFDYRGLIEKSLAIIAPVDIYKTE